MKRRHAWLMMSLLPSLLLAGCSRQVVQTDNPTPLQADQYEAYFDSATQVLRDNGFVIDRRDYRFGQITTRPQGSPNIFEVWNPQNTTADQAIESTLASEQRRVSVTFTGIASPDMASDLPLPPAEGSGEGPPTQTGSDPASKMAAGYAVQVRVILERRQIPTRRMAGSARRNVFSNLSAPPRDLIDRGITASYFEPVGRDEYLEARLIKQITDRANATD
jgi:hypothetical protein